MKPIKLLVARRRRARRRRAGAVVIHTFVCCYCHRLRPLGHVDYAAWHPLPVALALAKEDLECGLALACRHCLAPARKGKPMNTECYVYHLNDTLRSYGVRVIRMTHDLSGMFIAMPGGTITEPELGSSTRGMEFLQHTLPGGATVYETRYYNPKDEYICSAVSDRRADLPLPKAVLL